MSPSRTSILLAAAAVAVLLASSPFAKEAPAPAGDRLVVHEWGTFTSMQGSDGTGLEGLQHEEERLPPFVYSRTEVRECPLREYGYKGLEVPVRGVTQKMETPVIYFHTRKPQQVKVRVDFVDGLLTQWYPVSDRLGPPELSGDAGPLDISTIERSFLEWRVELIPPSQPAPAFPVVDEHDIWNYARQVHCASVRTLPRVGKDRMGPVEAERYLFYRGLGEFTLPVEVHCLSDGEAVFVNPRKETIPALFAVEMTEKLGRFRQIDSVKGRGKTLFSLQDQELTDKDEVVARLSRDVGEALVSQGLFPDEARAMVRTWARQWFSTTGTRVLYIVPRQWTDEILPLSIEPAPDETVRVLVGRLEFLTPAAERAVEKALAAYATVDARAGGHAYLMKLDRFLEPNLRRVLATTKDPRVREAAEELLSELGGN